MHALLAAALLFGVASPASAQIMPPPSRYDHPYRGRLDVIRTEAALQPCCQVQNRPFAGQRSTDITERLWRNPFPSF